MYRKPIGPTAHGVIDYAFATLNTLAPTLFGLTGPAKAISYSFAATQGTLNALTDTVLPATRPLPPFLPQNTSTGSPPPSPPRRIRSPPPLTTWPRTLARGLADADPTFVVSRCPDDHPAPATRLKDVVCRTDTGNRRKR